MNYDPQKYVVRVAPTTWVLAPFQEDVGTLLQENKLEPLNLQATLQGIAEIDVSLVYDPVEWNVEWVHGKDVTPVDLQDLAVRV